MEKKKMFLALGVMGTLTLGIVSATLYANNQGSLVKATEHSDYTQTLTFNASNLSSGSGSVTLNGNTFNYTGVVVDGSNVTFGTGSTLKFMSESGATISDDGMVGGSFKSIDFISVGNCSFTYTFNDASGLNVEASDGETVEQSINTTKFDIAITAGSFTTAAFNIKYDCAAPVESHNVLIVGSQDVINVSSTYNGSAYVDLMAGLGNTATYTVPTIDTYTFKVLADSTTVGGKRLRNALNGGDFDTIVLQICRRITPSATDVLARELEALAAIKDLLHNETDDIYVLAPQCSANPTIFTDDGTVKYASTGTNENKTQAEMCYFYAGLAQTMATAVEGKVMNFAQPFNDYDSAHTFQTSSKHLLFGYVFYCTFYNRMVPSACTYDAGASANAVKFVRESAGKFCIH